MGAEVWGWLCHGFSGSAAMNEPDRNGSAFIPRRCAFSSKKIHSVCQSGKENSLYVILMHTSSFVLTLACVTGLMKSPWRRSGPFLFLGF
jgi:hypothetical protein